MKTLPLPSRLSPGFSLAELVTMIALLGILTSVFVVKTGSQMAGAEGAKLEADVRQLNQMVSLYKADGGSLANLTRVRDVMTKLKNFRPENTLKSHTGATSGRLLDARMEPVMRSGSPGQKRAVWNASAQRFELVSDTREGAFEFELDLTKSAQAGQAENRLGGQVVRFDGSKGPSWIWGAPAAEAVAPYREPSDMMGTAQTNAFDPTVTKASSGGTGGTGGGTGGSGGGGTDGGGSGGGTPAPVALPAPKTNSGSGGGTYAYNSFPSAVTLSANGAPAGDSVLEYRLNGGAWQTYGGASIAVQPGDALEARNVPAAGVTIYTESPISRDEYYRLIEGFTGGLQAGFGDVLGGSDVAFTVESPSANETKLIHGNTRTDLGNGEIFDTGLPNEITFKSQSFDQIQPNAWFSVGDVTMLNGKVYNGSEATKATLALNLNLSNPARTGVVEIDLELVNTIDSADRTASADIVKLANPVSDFVVTIDGINYRLELGWENTNPAAGVVQGSDFLVFEDGTATGQLRARFVSDR